ncbi:MAG TPA: hypothetical protein VFM55_02185 [Micromonosporaceae bacterium]|nr:hypothetical protein [Micromonosporaceae bacterium]
MTAILAGSPAAAAHGRRLYDERGPLIGLGRRLNPWVGVEVDEHVGPTAAMHVAYPDMPLVPGGAPARSRS